MVGNVSFSTIKRSLDMGYQRRKSSRILEQAEIRAAGLTAIDPNLDFGNGRSLQLLKEQIDELQDWINTYNTELTNLDNTRSTIKAREKKLRELNANMLVLVALQYGKDSPEYAMAGGVRTSDRGRRSRSRTEVEMTAEAS
jgi:hypothetical protein